VLVLRDGIVGSVGNWIRASKRKVTLHQITQESDSKAHDEQHDWRPAGLPNTDEGI